MAARVDAQDSEKGEERQKGKQVLISIKLDKISSRFGTQGGFCFFGKALSFFLDDDVQKPKINPLIFGLL